MQFKERLEDMIQRVARMGYPEEIEEIGVDFSLFLAHSKKDSYEFACLNFEKKYEMNYSDFVQKIEEKKQNGGFDLDEIEAKDDQMDWEFAEAAKLWWIEKIEKITARF
ncbi:hypothetical protein IIA15_08905 [candidate division TA06 bacterium]|nr:hypothetical protein [candidate division TA06 bacterium]